MKKLFFTLAFAAMAVVAVNAQPRAIGGNLGADLGFSYQHGFGEANMLDVAVALPLHYLGDGFGIGGKVTYNWIDPFGTSVPWTNKGEWHWYMGVGGGLAAWGFDKDTWWSVGAVGQVGIEYDFWFPLQLSLDWRPQFGYNSSLDNFDTWGLAGISLGVRYRF